MKCETDQPKLSGSTAALHRAGYRFNPQNLQLKGSQMEIVVNICRLVSLWRVTFGMSEKDP